MESSRFGTSDPTRTAAEDRLAILELTARLALLFDARDWNALEGLFTNPVYSDRTSLFGGEPQTNTPAELVGGLQNVLGKLDTTHHLISCQVINPNGDEATSAANMQGTHVLANASAGSQWVVAGRHDYQLKTDGRRLADRRDHVHPLMGEWQRAHLDSRDRCLTTLPLQIPWPADMRASAS